MTMPMIANIISANRAAYIGSEPDGNFTRVKYMTAMNDL